jgi:hypothetical protein
VRALAGLSALVGLVACGMRPPAQQTVFPTLEPSNGPPPRPASTASASEYELTDDVAQDKFFPAPAAYNSRVVALRTSLGRAAIALELAGKTTTIRSTACDEPEESRVQAGCARCELAGESDALDGAVLEALTAAFNAYSADALEATHIERVALCKTLTYDNRRPPAGTVDLHARRLLLSVAPFIGHRYKTTGPVTTDDIVHHELFHMLEFERMRANYVDDPEWRLHNPQGFAYEDGAEERPRQVGFVDEYAASAEVEDKASVFQYLMARPDELCTVGATDPIVRAKTRLLWERVVPLLGDATLRARASCAAAWLE